jgi:putative phosphoribosyl transferase
MVEVKIPINEISAINGNLTTPQGANAVVVFAHGSGSGRFSPRNQYVAKVFNQAGIATLLIDLLTPEEEEIDVVTTEYRFNIELLAQRLVTATQWLKQDLKTSAMTFGFFGASTGAAAALIGAAKLPDIVKAVVSRGGRPDLAGNFLEQVESPTLFLVGGLDEVVLDLNRQAMAQMSAETRLVVVEGATHLFEEQGKLEEVAKLSSDWFVRHL